MANVIQSCPNCPPPNNLCVELLDKINELINRNKKDFGNQGTHGLKYRFPEQINGANGPGTTSWDNHEQQIKNQQKSLEKRLREYEKNGCGPPPPTAWSWATRPVPSPNEWRKPVTATPPINSDALKKAGKSVVVVGGGIGIGYLIYRVVRFLPSLIPPLWGTIPANVAIP